MECRICGKLSANCQTQIEALRWTEGGRASHLAAPMPSCQPSSLGFVSPDGALLSWPRRARSDRAAPKTWGNTEGTASGVEKMRELSFSLEEQMRSFRTAAALALACVALALTGCATPAQTEMMVVDKGLAGRVQPSSPMYGNVGIKDVTGGSETNPAWLSKVGSAEFERALEDSLRAAGLLAQSRDSGRFLLSAHLQKLDQPLLGVDITVTAVVVYTVWQRASGANVYEKTISTPYTAKFSDALYGPTRLRLANEGAIRANIGQLVDELSRLRIDGVGSR
jgi:hypothetical protein